jgi:hypothetical protein
MSLIAQPPSMPVEINKAFAVQSASEARFFVENVSQLSDPR